MRTVRGESEGVEVNTPRLPLPNRSRWMDWKPKGRAFQEPSETQPTSPPERGFVGFVGTHSGDLPEIGTESDLSSATISMEKALKGSAVSLWCSSTQERFWLVADEEDANLTGEARGHIYTAVEAQCLIRVDNPLIVIMLLRAASRFRWRVQAL